MGSSAVAREDRPFNPGSAYKNGKLYLFSNDSALVVRAWPRPRAWWRREGEPWRGARPLQLELDSPEQAAALPARHGLRRGRLLRLRNQAAAFAAIPEEQRLLAARFGVRAWPVHVLLSRVPGAFELARANPALAVGLVFCGSLRSPVQRPLRSARRLLAQPGPRSAQRVAEWLGFDPSRAVVRALRKLRHDQATPWNLQLMQRALGQLHTHRLLMHLPALNGAVFLLLRSLLDPESPVKQANALALELSRLEPGLAAHAESKLQVLIGAWSLANPERPLPRLRSLAQLERLYLEACTLLGAQIHQWGGERQHFPEPPIPAVRTPEVRILPLSTPAQLVEEGFDMRHCVGNRSYLLQAAGGSGYGYSIRLQGVQGEQRATAWVVPAEGRCHQLAELNGSRNGEVSSDLQAAVQAWLAAYNERALKGLLPPVPEDTRSPESLDELRWLTEATLYWPTLALITHYRGCVQPYDSAQPYGDGPYHGGVFDEMPF